MNAYLEYDPDVFRGKVILLSCDDPESLEISGWHRRTPADARRWLSSRTVQTNLPPYLARAHTRSIPTRAIIRLEAMWR